MIAMKIWFAELEEDYELPKFGILLLERDCVSLITEIRLLSGNNKIFLKEYNYMEWEVMIYRTDGDYLIGNSVTGLWEDVWVMVD